MTLSSRIRNRRSLRKTGTWPDDSATGGLEALQAWAASDNTATSKHKNRILHLIKKHRTPRDGTSTSVVKYNRERNPGASVISKPLNISTARPKHESQNRTAAASVAPQPTSLHLAQPIERPMNAATAPSVDKRVSNSTLVQQPPSILSVPMSQRPPGHKLVGLDPQFCFSTTQRFDVKMRIRSRFAQADFISVDGGRFLNVYTSRRKDHHVRTTLIRGAQGPMFMIQEDWRSFGRAFWGCTADINVYDMRSKIGVVRNLGADARPRHAITFRNSARTGSDGNRTSDLITLRIAGSSSLGHIRVMMDHKNEQGAMVETCLAQCSREHFTFGRKAKMEVRAGVDVAFITAFVGWALNWRLIKAAESAASSSAQVMGP